MLTHAHPYGMPRKEHIYVGHVFFGFWGFYIWSVDLDSQSPSFYSFFKAGLSGWSKPFIADLW